MTGCLQARLRVQRHVQETEQEPAEERVPEWGLAWVLGTLLLL